jgi:hypothetical protein
MSNINYESYNYVMTIDEITNNQKAQGNITETL